MIKINIIFHSVYGHIYEMAKAIAAGAASVPNVEVTIKQVEETLPKSILKEMNGYESKQLLQHIPVAAVEDLVEADAVILGAPTYFGQMSAQMLSFLNAAGEFWANGATIDKIGSAFSAAADQNGGADDVLRGLHTVMLHFGYIIVGCPTSLAITEAHLEDEITGGSCYGAYSTCGEGTSRGISENERKLAFQQGKHVAEITKKLHGNN
ncbi:MAG: NAD(P)H:quinone oxidoreductase [Clostridia bacterium]